MRLEGRGGDGSVESVGTNHVMTKIAFHFLDQPDNRHNGNRFCLVFYQQCFPKMKENRKRTDHRGGQDALRASL